MSIDRSRKDSSRDVTVSQVRQRVSDVRTPSNKRWTSVGSSEDLLEEVCAGPEERVPTEPDTKQRFVSNNPVRVVDTRTVIVRSVQRTVFVIPVSLNLLDNLIEQVVEELVRVLVLCSLEELVDGFEFIDEGSGRNGSLFCRMFGDIHEEGAQGGEERGWVYRDRCLVVLSCARRRFARRALA